MNDEKAFLMHSFLELKIELSSRAKNVQSGLETTDQWLEVACERGPPSSKVPKKPGGSHVCCLVLLDAQKGAAVT